MLFPSLSGARGGRQGSRGEALEALLGIEKVQRLAEDVTGTRLACQALLEVLFEAKDWGSLNEHIILLSKRRSQLKQARSVAEGAGLPIGAQLLCVPGFRCGFVPDEGPSLAF